MNISVHPDIRMNISVHPDIRMNISAYPDGRMEGGSDSSGEPDRRMDRGAASLPDFFIRFPGFRFPIVGVRVPGIPGNSARIPGYLEMGIPGIRRK
jgi:hypothetical protein